MFSRRHFLYLSAAGALAAAAPRMTGKQRVDRALKGEDVDRTPFSYWHHFGLEKLPGERVAEATSPAGSSGPLTLNPKLSDGIYMLDFEVRDNSVVLARRVLKVAVVK